MATTFSFVRVGSHERESRARFARLLGAVLSFAVYKSACIGFERTGELLLSITFDSCLWALAWLLSEAIARTRFAYREWLADALFYPLLYGSAALVFAHAWFFDAAVERRLTLLDVTPSGILAFFAEALPLAGYLALSALLVGMHLIAYLASANLKRPGLRSAPLVLAPLALVTGVGSALAPRTPSVLFDSGQEQWQLLSLPRVEVERSERASKLVPRLDRSRARAKPRAPTFSKVIVLVMETMTERKLAEESAQLSPETFMHSGRSRLHRYTGYFPNNQDSRTGMLDMLSSRLIPFEAYNDADVAAYAGLAAKPSLVDSFRARDYQTAFVVSQVAIEDVVADLHWDAKLNLTPRDIERARGNLLCFAPDEWENGCEDLAVLPKLLDFVKQNERAFVYQELVWGHDYAYNSASGKSNTAYYSGYVDVLLRGLDEAGVADDTLLVLTSDHGFRDKSLQRERWVYEIPLLFHALRFEPRSDGRLFSHVDFHDLLFSELAEATEALSESPLVMIVGPTGSGMITAISSHNDFTVLHRRGPFWRVQTEQRTARTALMPGELRYLFESYRSLFESDLR